MSYSIDVAVGQSRKAIRFLVAILAAIVISPPCVSSEEPSEATVSAIKALQAVGKQEQGLTAAVEAATVLRQAGTEEIPAMLDGMQSANSLSQNWFRGIVFDVTRKAGAPSVEVLSRYAMDQRKNALGRGLAMELLAKQDRVKAESLIAKCLNDPSLPLRLMAVEQAIGKATSLADSDRKDDAATIYQEALTAARHPRQLARIVDALKELDQDVSLGDAFAMIGSWKVVAPFDNRDGIGYAAVYGPEETFSQGESVDLQATYEGKNGDSKWQDIEPEGDDGKVDLAKAYNKEKGAVAYLFTRFDSSRDRSVQFRLGCINANKVWLNGKLIMANEVYHSGSMIDQYLADAKLKQGTNEILLKICQNEQTQPWAQEWDFQFRITDPTGKGLRSGE
ncbi:MAG: hypothetical protein AAGA03_05305 [Planctomycetota bacterium]